MIFDCNKSEFAAIIGRSRAFVDLLSKMGVIAVGYGNEVFLQRSLHQYFFDYLYHLGNEGRNNEFLAAVQRICKLKPRRKKFDGLNSCRRLLPLIHQAELNLAVLKILKKLGGQFSPRFIISAEMELNNLRDLLKKSKNELRQKILSAQIKPVQVETILLARYVDCDKWQAISEDYSYSLSHIYRLHRQGINFLKSVAQI